jgi:hypothetical protein
MGMLARSRTPSVLLILGQLAYLSFLQAFFFRDTIKTKEGYAIAVGQLHSLLLFAGSSCNKRIG